jgi:hypothetical protein
VNAAGSSCPQCGGVVARAWRPALSPYLLLEPCGHRGYPSAGKLYTLDGESK